jgi:sterol desaturase/sphingolipid hydroxylase (fatty acid hydroxylase superfamily)
MRLSKLGYYGDFFVSLALIAFMVGYAVLLPNWFMRAVWVFHAVLGAVGWTLVEYLLHRWVYHHVAFFREAHAVHHAEPNAYFGAPPVVGIVLIFAIFFAPLATIHPVAATGLTTGVLMGYVGYMLVHHAAHYWTLSQASWLYHARRHHALHHYHSKDCNFGITTSIWDHVFGTAVMTGREPNEVPVDELCALDASGVSTALPKPNSTRY